MTKEQALQLIDILLKQIRLTRDEHNQVLLALKVLTED